MMNPGSTEFLFDGAATAAVESRLEHLAAVISGDPYADAGTATLQSLRELYDSANPALARFVENLLHCVVCSSHRRCEDCQYRQVPRDYR